MVIRPGIIKQSSQPNSDRLPLLCYGAEETAELLTKCKF